MTNQPLASLRLPGLAALTLGMLGLLVESRAAQLNCNNQQCVEVRYTAKDPPNDLSNVNCWIEPDDQTGPFVRAYSLSFAKKGYGIDSKGGIAGTPVDGNWRRCTGTQDCPGPALRPISGVVATYTSAPVNGPFNTVCPGGGS